MKRFLKTILIFAFILFITGELIVRAFQLVPEIPERYIDDYGIQRYKPNQSGYFTKAVTKWNVNKYGWVGTHEVKKDRTISIIGDSFIENLMNPIECNQGSLLKQDLPNYAFFEAARSGITFIEAFEITNVLEKEINPLYHLIYVSDNDFYESISEINRQTDKLQISVTDKKLLPTQLKSPGLKKVLYNIKLLYYFYLKYPFFIEKQNQGKKSNAIFETNKFDSVMFNDLLSYCSYNYKLNKIILVLRPNTDKRIVALLNSYNIKTILLNSTNDKSWERSSVDEHWSCYGHHQASKQVIIKLKELLK
jgi:hypothetical protein